MTFEYRPRTAFDHAIDESRCRAMVSPPGRGCQVDQCGRKAKGKWCHQHEPGAQEARRARAIERYQDKQSAMERASEQRALKHPAVVAQREALEAEIDSLNRELGELNR